MRNNAPLAPSFTLTLTEDTNLDLNLTLYYRETEDQRLCMIHPAPHCPPPHLVVK